MKYKTLLLAISLMVLPLLSWGQETDARLAQAQSYMETENWIALRQMGEQDIAQGNPDGYALLAICDANLKGDKKAVATLKKGASKGSQDCLKSLVSYYNSNQLYAKAYDLLKKHPNAENQYRMAYMILQGRVKKQGLEQALALLNQSADGGYEEALQLLGFIYSKEDFGLKNDRVAMGYYQRLADMGNPEGLFMIGNVYEYQGDSAQCLAYYRRAAEAGHGDAWRFLGEFYMNGHWLPCDSTEAFQCYWKAMECGEAAGYDFVGQSYLRGVGVAKDTLAAMPYLLQAARMGQGRDCAFVGKAFEKGLFGLEKSTDSALFYYRIGSRADDPVCDYEMGQRILSQGDAERALPFIYNAANNGHNEAILLFAECVQNGLGVDADPAYAYQIFSKLAQEEQYADAYMKLGAAHLFGQGCEQSEALAYRYTDTAAHLGSELGCVNLAVFHFQGVGCERDSVVGLEWLTRAAEMGNATAINRLGDFYESKEDYKQAVRWYERGVELGNLTAMCNLGVCYQEGNGVVLNSKRAYELFLEAAENGSARGMYHVAMCYMDEVYVTDDIDQTLLWFTRAAEKGHTLSCYMLGILYANGAENSQGQVLKADKKKARQYLKMAADNDFEPAIEALKKL